ncbi:glycosyltransferase family 4 protein [Proteiniphilum sp.]|uniref:glycosyltransferase family 4 protein n=1 Tax=Proteiniphilum sp. TaxID=1926877 RepID=UPI003327814B
MKKKILFLQSEIHNYHISLLKEIVDTYGYNIIVIYKDKNTQTPYVPPKLDGVEFIGKSSFDDFKALKSYVLRLELVLIRTSGWMDKEYLRISRGLKKRKNIVVAVSDTQWKNNFKQTLGAFLIGRYIKNSFSKIMVAGPYQFEYARRIGFSKKDILFNNLSADTNVYDTIKIDNDYSKTILYVGNLEEVKGTHILLEAWSSLKEKNGWKLELIGQGKFFNYTIAPDIVYRGYLENIEIHDAMKSSGFLILPSKREQWGVVMHEATLSGLPIICSDEVGAIPYFLISGYNGFTFQTGNVKDLADKLEFILNLKEEEIRQMKKNSLSLGHRITTPISAASLMSAIIS